MNKTSHFIALIVITLSIPYSYSHPLNDYLPMIDDFLRPWREPVNSKPGISLDLIEQTYRHWGSHVIFQVVDHQIYFYDPSGFCQCNNSVYGGVHDHFISHLRLCRSIAKILEATIEVDPSLNNFEMVVSLDDLPMWLTDQPGTTTGPYPGFGSIRCWSKPTLPIPFLASNQEWDISTFEADIEEDLRNLKSIINTRNLKLQDKAIFRGGIHRGCSFERNTQVDFDYAQAFPTNLRTCGRWLLRHYAQNHSDLIDYQDDYLPLTDQVTKFKYLLNVEGFGGWADRLFTLLHYPTTILHQSGPCDQWFEPLLAPMKHYLPIAHDFRDLEGQILWANHHPAQVQEIQRRGQQFAKEYLSRRAVLFYMRHLLRGYLELLDYRLLNPRNGSQPIEQLWWDARRLKSFCQLLD